MLGVGTSDAAGTDADFVTWINPPYASLRRKVAKIIPDRYSAVVTFDVAAGANTYAIVASDFESARKVGRRSGSGAAYLPLPLLPFATAEWAPNLGWRQRGTTLDFFPIIAAPNTAGVDNYQLTYLTKAATLAAADTVDLPAGMEAILELHAAAKGSHRLGEHAAARGYLDEALTLERAELTALANMYPGSPDAAADVTGWY